MSLINQQVDKFLWII